MNGAEALMPMSVCEDVELADEEKLAMFLPFPPVLNRCFHTLGIDPSCKLLASDLQKNIIQCWLCEC